MPISKQNTNLKKNLQTIQPYPTNLITTDNKNIEQTTSILIKNKTNDSNALTPNKKTKISNEVPPMTIENIIDSIILTPSPKSDNSSSEHQSSPLSDQKDFLNTSIMDIDSTTFTESKNTFTNTSMHAHQNTLNLSQQNYSIPSNLDKGKQKEM
ncbi:17288_t:CDS:1 [Funneliformis geosporum]|nr:17288_t:CDS:1 [Funneliformis geosporum]